MAGGGYLCHSTLWTCQSTIEVNKALVCEGAVFHLRRGPVEIPQPAPEPMSPIGHLYPALCYVHGGWACLYLASSCGHTWMKVLGRGLSSDQMGSFGEGWHWVQNVLSFQGAQWLGSVTGHLKQGVHSPPLELCSPSFPCSSSRVNPCPDWKSASLPPSVMASMLWTLWMPQGSHAPNQPDR